MSELNKVEKYLNESIIRLAETGYLDENPRANYKSDGTPSHSLSIRGGVYEVYDISKNEFPITETRKIPWKSGIREIDVIYNLQSNKLEDFEANKCGWWKDWEVDNTGTIGSRYGYTVQKYDLMNKLLKGLEENPFGKRHLINLYQYADLEETEGLHPCAYETLWTVSKVNGEKYLDMTLIQRSSDAIIAGTGVNQLQYVSLMMRVAKHLGIKCGLFEYYRKNWHVYDRAISEVLQTIERIKQLKKREVQSTPKLILNVPDGTNFYDISADDFELVDYNPIEPQLKFDLAI